MIIFDISHIYGNLSARSENNESTIVKTGLSAQGRYKKNAGPFGGSKRIALADHSNSLPPSAAENHTRRRTTGEITTKPAFHA
jgi:hypothetical protein